MKMEKRNKEIKKMIEASNKKRINLAKESGVHVNTIFSWEKNINIANDALLQLILACSENESQLVSNILKIANKKSDYFRKK